GHRGDQQAVVTARYDAGEGSARIPTQTVRHEPFRMDERFRFFRRRIPGAATDQVISDHGVIRWSGAFGFDSPPGRRTNPRPLVARPSRQPTPPAACISHSTPTPVRA